MSEANSTLSPELASIVARAPAALRDSIAAFMRAASHVINFMGEPDLTQLHVTADGSMDADSAATVRAVAPVTAAAARAFLNVVQGFVPASPSAVGNADLAAAYELIAHSGRSLAQEVATHDAHLADPQVAADNWRVLEIAASLRGKTRYAAGEMLYYLCRAFDEGRKEDFVPSYEEDVEISMVVRRGITELRQHVRICVSSMGAVPNDEIPGWVRKLSDSLTEFYQQRAYTCMRVADKRVLMSHHRAMRALLAEPKSTTGQFIKCIDAVMLFFESLLRINQRAVLIAHDKERIVAAREHLMSSVENLLTSNISAALHELALGYDSVYATFGRDRQLDNVLMAYRHISFVDIPQAHLLGAAEALLAVVDGVGSF